MFIKREISGKIIEAARKMPVITVSGTRQSGKTTLVKEIFPDHDYWNMEFPLTKERFLSDPMSFFKNINKGVIIDEFQNVPEILSYIQVISDDSQQPGKFILTGSQNLMILEKVSQSLAGRTALFYLLPFGLTELTGTVFEMKNSDDYIFKGFYPRIYSEGLNSFEWLTDYINLYLERDVKKMINIHDAAPFNTLIKLCAGRTGQIINFSTLSDIIGKDAKTIRAWLYALEASYIIFFLNPYYKNFNKRITKSPKLYFYDTGLVSTLLGIKNVQDLDLHYLKGQLFENFIISEFIKYNYHNRLGFEFYFRNEQGNNEIDLLIESGSNLAAVEIKSSFSFSKEFIKNILRFKNLTWNNLVFGSVISNIEEQFTIQNVNMVNWKNLIEVLKQL